MPKIIVLDFDGVIHSYVSGWAGYAVIKDPPVEGALSFIRQLIDAKTKTGSSRYSVYIISSRTSFPSAIDAIKQWFLMHGLESEYLDKIQFESEKPPAHLLIDDRGFHFEGKFPSLDFIDTFKPWNKK